MDPITYIIDYWQWILLGLFVAEKIVKISPCTWDDIVVDGIKAALQSMTGRKIGMLLIVAGMAGAVTLPGCAMKSLAAPDKAAAIGYELSQAYTAAHAQYLAVYEVSDDGVRDVMRDKIAPALNTAKHTIAAYCEAAAVYKDTSQEPPDLAALLAAAVRAMGDVTEILDTWMPKE
ncbi:MAG: hypothetical protein AB7E47_02330 [Desulfovibrionaceae bacterium]